MNFNILFIFCALIGATLLQNNKLGAQCSSCSVTNPVSSGNYTFTTNSTVCFTSNATLGDVTFQNNSKICVASGVTVIIQNNLNTTTGNNIEFQVSGTLQFNQNPQINANLTAHVASGGILRAGTNGSNNFTFNGSNNIVNNYGTFQMAVLGFNNNSATNIIDNYGTLSISQNINVSGANTVFRNHNFINVGANFNLNATTKFINCATTNIQVGFNLGGGWVINTSNLTTGINGSGNIDLAGNSKIDNYGTFNSNGGINFNSSNAILYNEGLAIIRNLQINGGWMRGPSNSSKMGYFQFINPATGNNPRIGPNLDFARTSGPSNQGTLWQGQPVFVNQNNVTTTQALANVTYNCASSNNCSAPMITSFSICPNLDGSFPQASAQADINQTQVNVPTSGNLLTNDKNTTQVTAASQGATNIPIGTPTAITGGTITINANGTYTFVPVSGFEGVVPTISYTSIDAGNISSSTTSLTIKVVSPVNSSTNNSPVALPITASVLANQSITFNVAANSSDLDGNTLTVSNISGLTINGTPFNLTSTPQNVYNASGILAGQASVSAGQLIFTANSSFAGNAPFVYTVNDGNSGTASSQVSVTVVPTVANLIFANDNAIAALQGQTMSGNVLTNDQLSGTNPAISSAVAQFGGTDYPLTIGSATTIPNVGNVTLNANGTYTFVPLVNFVGTLPIAYTVCNAQANCSSATLYATSIAGIVAAVEDVFDTPTNSTLNGNILANDVNARQIITASQGAITIPLGVPTAITGGTITVNSNGTFTFVAAAGFVGFVPDIEYEAENFNATSSAKSLIKIEVFSALPVELIGIQIACVNDGKNVEISWQTASELNSDLFIVERSFDGYLWTTVGQIEAAGTTTEKKEYSFIDKESRPSRIVYYKLSQVDFDGSKTTYPILSSNCEIPEEIKLYPNPVSDLTYIEMVNNKSERVVIELRNMTGSLMNSAQYTLIDGTNLLSLEVESLQPGTYYAIILHENAERKVVKFIKL